MNAETPMNDATADSAKATVLAWWQSMQDRNLDTLEALTMPDYISAGGPGSRTLGRDAFLEEAGAFLGAGTIEHWAVHKFRNRLHGNVAVCSYLWHERGTHGTEAFEFAGIATDVLVRTDGRWRYQAHHVSLSPITSQGEPV